MVPVQFLGGPRVATPVAYPTHKESQRMTIKTLGLMALVVAIATMLGTVSTAQQETDKEKAKQGVQPPPFPYTPEKAHEIEKSNALPIDKDFYATPKELIGPGELLRCKECSDYRRGPAGPRAQRRGPSGQET